VFDGLWHCKVTHDHNPDSDSLNNYITLSMPTAMHFCWGKTGSYKQSILYSGLTIKQGNFFYKQLESPSDGFTDF